MDAAQTPRLALAGVTKRFPGCLANDAVDLEVMPGEIHALLGENGAGKSTLVKIIYGVLAADSGTIVWEGQPVTIKDPNTARKLGIGMVFQHFSLFEALTVLENIALGMPGERDMTALSARVHEISNAYGLPLDPDRYVHDLSVGERQRIEILRCLLQDPKLLIMDEPTSVLTPQEAEKLFETLRRLASEGCSILYISHKLEEIRALCHRATVLRHGKVVAACDPTKETAASLAGMMIGTELTRPVQQSERVPGEVRLEVKALSLVSPEPFGIDLNAVSFALRAGEILGIAGVAGNGQIELQEALSGEVLVEDAASVSIDGRPVGRDGPLARRLKGLAFLPEERLGHGAVPGMTLADNALLSGFGPKKLLGAGGVIRESETVRFAEGVIKRFDVRTSGVEAEARALSGGNLQKFIIGREIEQEPTILIAAQPTWGVDAGAAALIHQALFDLASDGAAVLVISQDLDELLAISDRLAVLHLGELSASYPTSEVSAEQIGLLMGGAGTPAGVDQSARPGPAS
ncbi:MAG: ABC transporter ATP-binding protein [Alphaproteobacteria bacterium]|nr:ABC transporter ATP-binding protein [Alphaproteobacteria bacterium]